MAQSRRDALRLSNQSLDGMDLVLAKDEVHENVITKDAAMIKPSEHSDKLETLLKEKSGTQKKTLKEKTLMKRAVTICIPDDLSTYFTIKANRSGKTMQDFFEIIVKKNAKSVKNIDPFDESLNKYRVSKTKFSRRSIIVSDETRNLLLESSSIMGLRVGEYMYYMIDQEKLHDKDSPDFK